MAWSPLRGANMQHRPHPNTSPAASPHPRPPQFLKACNDHATVGAPELRDLIVAHDNEGVLDVLRQVGGKGRAQGGQGLYTCLLAAAAASPWPGTRPPAPTCSHPLSPAVLQARRRGQEQPQQGVPRLRLPAAGWQRAAGRGGWPLRQKSGRHSSRGGPWLGSALGKSLGTATLGWGVTFGRMVDLCDPTTVPALY